MKKLHGFVLVKETNNGIPKLVVSAYDAEINLRDLIIDSTATDTALFPQLSPQILERLGKRLGSVLTGPEGQFEMSSDDLHFQGNESRPDLVLVILAPEDVIDAGHPYPYPPDKRILYISSVSRTDAGAEEAYFIRLLQAQLDTFHIQTGLTRPEEDETDSTQLFNATKTVWDFRDNLRTKLAPTLQIQLNNATAIRNNAKELTKDLTALPAYLRGNPLLLKDPSQLSDMQRTAISNGLDRLKDKYKGTLDLKLSPQQLADLGLTTAPGGEITGQVDLTILAEKITANIGGTDLIRVRGFVDNSISPDVLLQKYSIPAI